jgi:hypothetical protein
MMSEWTMEAITSRYGRAQERRRRWERLWRECYLYALPERGTGLSSTFAPASNHAERLFDGTATDAVEQLAASLLAELTPPWSRWFRLCAGSEVDPSEEGALAEFLDRAGRSVQAHFDSSNLAVEIHQTFLDLVTVGTATLALEEAPFGHVSALRFTAVPAADIFVEENGDGQINGHFRRSALNLEDIRSRFPEAVLPRDLLDLAGAQRDRRFDVVEAVMPDGSSFRYAAFLHGDATLGHVPLAEGRFDSSPFITVRWLKGAGEIYGRSPVMSALPDIKTANKVVELILKNASIAATGIWLADDDGVLNPANIRLVPGSIIPKAVGSAGLTPLAAPGRFDVSQLVLDDLRSRIRHTLLVDRLGPVNGAKMTATEVLARSAEMSRLLGAVYGRLQSELLTPLVTRALCILRRRGEIPPLFIDGRTIELRYQAPLAQAQARQDVQNTLLWLETVARMGEDALETVDLPAAARWLGRALAVPGELIRDDAGAPLPAGLELLADAIKSASLETVDEP